VRSSFRRSAIFIKITSKSSISKFVHWDNKKIKKGLDLSVWNVYYGDVPFQTNNK